MKHNQLFLVFLHRTIREGFVGNISGAFSTDLTSAWLNRRSNTGFIMVTKARHDTTKSYFPIDEILQC